MQATMFTNLGSPITPDMLRLGSQIERCARCRRPLSDPVSVSAGMGPICRSIGRGEDRSGSGDCHDLRWDAATGDIVLDRRCDGIHTNLPVVIAYHSPTGIEWGYEGSGPADLALSILAVFLPGDDERLRSSRTVSREAYRLHQAFKRAFVAPMPREGGTISGDVIRAWIAGQRLAQLNAQPDGAAGNGSGHDRADGAIMSAPTQAPAPHPMRTITRPTQGVCPCCKLTIILGDTVVIADGVTHHAGCFEQRSRTWKGRRRR